MPRNPLFTQYDVSLRTDDLQLHLQDQWHILPNLVLQAGFKTSLQTAGNHVITNQRNAPTAAVPVVFPTGTISSNGWFLPQVGATVAAMASCCEVESTKSVSEIFSPVSGTVAEVNSDLSDTPQMINEDPYGKGWIFAVELADQSELDGLMDAAAYRAFLEEPH